MSEQISDLMAEVVENIDYHLGRERLGDKPRATLQKMKAGVEMLIPYIEDVQQYTRLDLVSRIEESIPDIVEYDQLELDEAVSKSLLLNSIHKGGVNIQKFERFTDEQFQIADCLAALFKQVSGQLKAYRSMRKGREEGQFTYLTHGGEDFFQFIDFLQKQGIAKIQQVRLKRDDGSWVFFKPDYYASSKQEQHFLVIFNIVDGQRSQFIFGDWMTAFTYKVIKDHLTRNEIPHEIFAKVRYSAPVDIINSASDFDVIVLIGNQALCFECKSGRMDVPTTDKIIEKSAEIDGVLKRFVPNIDQFRFFAVFDETINDEEMVRASFNGTGVEAKRIDEIRGLIFDMFASGNPIAAQ